MKLKKKYQRIRKKAVETELRDKKKQKRLGLMYISPFMPKVLYNIVHDTVTNWGKDPRGHRYLLDNKVFCVLKQRTGPKAYKLDRHFMNLPSKTTLRTILNKIKLKAGINVHILESNERYFSSLTSKQRRVSIIFDEMRILQYLYYDEKLDIIIGFEDFGEKLGRTIKVANEAGTFMIQGLEIQFKIPIAFTYAKGAIPTNILVALLPEIIREVRRRGYFPVWIVCDQATQNVKALKLLGATEETPVIIIDDIVVVVSFDMPHVLKCFRNNIFIYNLHIGSKIIVKWGYVKYLYEKDKEYRPYHECQHLNKDNMEITKSDDKMRVKFACQVVSQRTAKNVVDAVIDVSKKVRLPRDALHTSDLISSVDKFFDAFNADSITAPANKPWKVALSDTSPHFKQLEEFKKSVKQWRFVSNKRNKGNTDWLTVNVPSVNSMIWNCNAVPILWSILKEAGFTHLFTRYLNSDVIENMHMKARATCGSGDTPTLSQFEDAIKTILINTNVEQTIGKFTSRKANCEEDNSFLMSDLKSFLLQDRNDVNISPAANNDTLDDQPMNMDEPTNHSDNNNAEKNSDTSESVIMSEDELAVLIDSDDTIQDIDKLNPEDFVRSVEKQLHWKIFMHKNMTSLVTLIIRELNKLVNCEKCVSTITTCEFRGDIHFSILMQEDNQTEIEFYPKIEFHDLCKDMLDSLMQYLSTDAFQDKICALCIELLQNYSPAQEFKLGCENHTKTYKLLLFKIISRIAIQNYINLQFQNEFRDQ
jgi:hypothetical protein